MSARGYLAVVMLGLAILVPGPAFATGIHHASPYARALTTVPGAGRTFTAFTYAWSEADGFYIGKNRVEFNTVPPLGGSRRLSMHGGAIYHEYGLSDRSAVSVHIPYIRTDAVTWNGIRQAEQDGVGDITARYRHLFNTGGLDLALALGFKAPGNHDPLLLNAPTKGQTDLFLEGAASTGIAYGLYAEASAGYRWRLADPDNDMTLGVELGWKEPFGIVGFTPRAYYDVVYSNGGIDIGAVGFNPASPATGLPATRTVRRVVGGVLDYEYKSMIFGVGYAKSHAGRNTDDGHTISVSAGMRY